MPSAQDEFRALLAMLDKGQDDPHGMTPGEEIRGYLTLHSSKQDRLKRAKAEQLYYNKRRKQEIKDMQGWLRQQQPDTLDLNPPVMNDDINYRISQHVNESNTLSDILSNLDVMHKEGHIPADKYELFRNTVQNRLDALNKEITPLERDSTMQALHELSNLKGRFSF